MRLGVLGVGHFAQFVVAGLRRFDPDLPITLSPRNRDRARELAAAHSCTVAADNATVVRECDVVILATRPAQAIEAAGGLPWHQDHLMVSVAAGVALDELQPVVGPGTGIRAMPVSSAEIGESPTAMFPDHAGARELLARLGSVHVLPDEPAFEAASVLGALYAWAFALAAEGERWTTAQGVEPELARELVVGMLRGAAGVMMGSPARSPSQLLDSLATPGGLTRLGLDVLRERGALEAWGAACDAALARVRDRSN